MGRTIPGNNQEGRQKWGW